MSDETTHTPACQHKTCSKSANDYDQRHGRLIFFCNTFNSFHDPMNYAASSFNKTLQLTCGNCNNRWRLDEQLDSETLEEFECPDCGTEAPIRVNN